MELGGEAPDLGRPPLEEEAIQALRQSVGSLLASYGWYLLLACVAGYLLLQKLAEKTRAPRRDRAHAAGAPPEPDVVVRREEALAAARFRMQEQLNEQAEKFKEKQRQLEEEKRRQKVAVWESMQEGKSYRGNLKRNQQETESAASASSTVPKPKPNKKPLRGGSYNPLSGEGGGTCAWRPGRRGGPSSAG
ncbi:selenoprotein S isoform X1 [Mauremys mutica]|uniref:selenoprotein S isoform X1 n=1 Tax=Mauremys mutica TaxID=74926 RepID=UPI001D15A094|nr:selenoprotein S isoform X1 [Mauremys mutica]